MMRTTALGHRLRFSCLAGALSALLLPACLGGGSSGTTTVQTAALQGTVYEVDGQTVDRSNVMVRVLETGATVSTDVNGDFTFEGLPPGSYTLEFDSTLNANLRAIAHQEGDGEGGTEGSGEEGSGEESGEKESDGESDGEKESDGERERDGDHDEEGEDHEGRPRIDVTRECGRIVIRVALEDGRVKEFVIERHDVRHAKARLHATEESSVDVEGAIRIRSGDEGEGMKVCVYGLEAGTVIEVCLDAREGAGPVSIGTVAANAEGGACLVRDTREGDTLPLGAASLSDLEGHRVEVKLAATGEVILVGEMPDLPEAGEHDCDRDEKGEGDGERDGEGEGDGEKDGEREDGDREEDERPHDGSTRGKAYLDALVDGVEGSIEIRCWPAEEIQALRICVHGELETETELAFEIQDPETDGGWILLGTRSVREGEACFGTERELPLGADSVRALVGLKVRVRSGDTVLLMGRVPELVRD